MYWEICHTLNMSLSPSNDPNHVSSYYIRICILYRYDIIVSRLQNELCISTVQPGSPFLMNKKKELVMHLKLKVEGKQLVGQ